MFLKRIVFLSFFLIFLYGNSAKCELLDDFLKEKSSDYDYIYIKNPNQIKGLDIVIYVLSDDKNHNFNKFFIKYSKKLGVNIGGLILNSNNSDNYYYRKYSTCNFSKGSKNLIIYNNRINGTCRYFQSNNVDDLYEAMTIVDKYIEKNINKDNTISDTEYTKYKFVQFLKSIDSDVINNLMSEFVLLYDDLLYLMED